VTIVPDGAFDAILISRPEGAGNQVVEQVRLHEADLMDGDTLVAVEYSTINYKDGLAITGAAPVVRRFPMIPGVDFAGRVVSGAGGRFSPGDAVILNGYGVGEVHYGGYAGRARVSSDWLIALPPKLTAAQAMAIGTAGYTAALSVRALQRGGVTPASGPVLVTGAAGGVGGIAVSLLSTLGFSVTASSRRADREGDYLRDLGAAEILDAGTLSEPGRPLAKERWAGAVDSVGSHTLANILAGTRRGGTVAACGLAQGSDLPATVMPFILRGISLVGIDSVMAPRAEREDAWSLLADVLDREALARITTTIGLDAVPETAAALLAGRIRGRVVVKL
jgi:acrylyl-CoA reductase (NADPH)